MSYRIIVLFTVLITFVVSCSNTSSWVGISQEIIKNFSRNNSCNFELFATGYGGSGTGQLKLLCMTLICRQKMTVDNARIPLLQFCEEFLKDINTNDKIKHELHNFPCTNENLDIILTFRDLYQKSFQAPYVANIILCDGKIHYSTSDENGKYIIIHRESYEEALKIYHDYMSQITK